MTTVSHPIFCCVGVGLWLRWGWAVTICYQKMILKLIIAPKAQFFYTIIIQKIQNEGEKFRCTDKIIHKPCFGLWSVVQP